MLVVVEFPAGASAPVVAAVWWRGVAPWALGRARDVARRLVEEGRCAVARGLFDVLAVLEIIGLDPERVRPRAWEHL